MPLRIARKYGDTVFNADEQSVGDLKQLVNSFESIAVC